MEKKKPEYYFRGTTLGFPGNPVNQQMPVTSISYNPAKAVVFAWFCRHKGSAIIYIGLAKDFATVPVQGKNTKAKVEEELGFAIKPFELTKFCEGYITLEEALAILRKLNIFIPSVLIDIDDCLKQMTIQPTDEQIENFYKLAQPLLKNT